MCHVSHNVICTRLIYLSRIKADGISDQNVKNLTIHCLSVDYVILMESQAVTLITFSFKYDICDAKITCQHIIQTCISCCNLWSAMQYMAFILYFCVIFRWLPTIYMLHLQTLLTLLAVV